MVKKHSVPGLFFFLLLFLMLSFGCRTMKSTDLRPEIAESGGPGGNVRTIEYKGSDIGDPVPPWMKFLPGDLEAHREFTGMYVFRFEINESDLDTLERKIRGYPISRKTSQAVLSRAQLKAETRARSMESFLEEAGRVLMSVEYIGVKRHGDFWVHELIFDERDEQRGERYRGWILVTVPREQVHAGLQLGFDTALSHQPPENEQQMKAQEALLAQFRLGF